MTSGKIPLAYLVRGLVNDLILRDGHDGTIVDWA
jgi:hypothetical protein